MNTTLKESKYISQRQSSQQKRQQPIYDRLDQSFQNDILNVEILKLQESLDYSQQKVKDLQSEILKNVSRREQDLMALNMQLQQMEHINNELVQRLQSQKKSEEYLTNANQHVTTLQKKLDHMHQENVAHQTNINNLTSQNYQLSNKWQKCSQQLKYITSNKGRMKDIEDQLQRKSDELTKMKEKYVASTLELTVCKQAEQEFKVNVQQKIKMLVDQLKDSEAQKNLMQNILIREQQPIPTREDDYNNCAQCQELLAENEHLHHQIETIEYTQMNQLPSQALKREVALLQQKCALLKEQNQNLQKQVEDNNNSFLAEEQIVTSLKQTFSNTENSLTKMSEYINCLRGIELYVHEPKAQEKMKQVFDELAQKIDQILSNSQVNEMYDRLLVKYYALIKNQTQLNLELTQHKKTNQTTPKKCEDDQVLEPHMFYQQNLNQSFDQGMHDNLKVRTIGKKPFQKF